MNLDDRLRRASDDLRTAVEHGAPDALDLDRRQRRNRVRHGAAMMVIVAALMGSAFAVSATGGGGERVTLAPEGQADSSLERIDGKTFVFERVPAGFELVGREERGTDGGSAFGGEQFTEVHVRFADAQDPLSAHSGAIAATIRVAVGNYDDRLREVFPGPGTPVVLGGLDFEIITVERETFIQTALVPVDKSERTFLLTGRNVDADTLIEMAATIDPTDPVPNAGPAPSDFVVVHSGRAEFPSLVGGTAVTYEGISEARSITVITYEGSPISCFAYAWVFPNTEIGRIGGDSGVISQLTGQPGGTGTYTALWNHDHDTLIAMTVVGVDRAELISLASDLEFRDAPLGAYVSDLPFAF